MSIASAHALPSLPSGSTQTIGPSKLSLHQPSSFISTGLSTIVTTFEVGTMIYPNVKWLCEYFKALIGNTIIILAYFCAKKK